jgi:hypothetical protein
VAIGDSPQIRDRKRDVHIPAVLVDIQFRPIIAAIGGGTASVATGGKFGNGALTAAMSAAIGDAALDSKRPRHAKPSGPKNVTFALGRRVASGAMDIAGRIWAFPNTIIGLAFGGAGTIFGVRPVWDSVNGILHFTDMPSWLTPSSMSFGHAHVYGKESYKKLDGTFEVNRVNIPVVREETLHTSQATVLGSTYLPLYGLSMLGSVVTGGGTHNHNLLEMGPESGRGLWPWGK